MLAIVSVMARLKLIYHIPVFVTLNRFLNIIPVFISNLTS